MAEKKYGPYSEKVIDHFQHPRNMGDMEDADSISKVGSPICGDELRVYLKVGKNSEGELYIEDIKYQSFGCAAAVATGSMMTELVKGKTLKEALDIDRTLISKELGGLPKVKIHCSLLSTDALQEAIYQYYMKNGMHVPESLENLHKEIERGNVIARAKQSQH